MALQFDQIGKTALADYAQKPTVSRSDWTTLAFGSLAALMAGISQEWIWLAGIAFPYGALVGGLLMQWKLKLMVRIALDDESA